LDRRCPPGLDLDAAQSFVRQAREYYAAADLARSTESQPLLYYYGFLNLGKALAIASGRTGLVGEVMHGLAVDELTAELTVAELHAYPSGPNSRGDHTVNAFDMFNSCISQSRLEVSTIYRVQELMAQTVFGHRLWVEASNRRERFIGIEKVELLHDEQNRESWVNIVVPERALVWRHRPKKEVLSQGHLAPAFDFVRGTVMRGDDIPYRVFQQSTPSSYAARPSDNLMDLINDVKPKLWRTYTSTMPFRRYYVYLSEPGEKRLPQLASIYALMFYLGSMIRYQPPRYEKMLNGQYGAFLNEFISSQPQQFLYGIACEFQQREVSRAAVV
jgi:hypothetical protein